MSFSYLWKNREKPHILSWQWLKVWAKRVLNMPGLLNIYIRRLRYTARGVKLGRLSVLGRLELNGPAKNLTIGEKSVISDGVHLALHGSVTVGNRVVINSGVKVLTASHYTNDPHWLMYAKPIVIEDFAWIATDAIILPGVRVGRGAVIAAGAVVSKDVPDFVVVVGNPARSAGNRYHALNYNPVDLCPPYEAWVGRPSVRED